MFISVYYNSISITNTFFNLGPVVIFFLESYMHNVNLTLLRSPSTRAIWHWRCSASWEWYWSFSLTSSSATPTRVSASSGSWPWSQPSPTPFLPSSCMTWRGESTASSPFSTSSLFRASWQDCARTYLLVRGHPSPFKCTTSPTSWWWSYFPTQANSYYTGPCTSRSLRISCPLDTPV